MLYNTESKQKKPSMKNPLCYTKVWLISNQIQQQANLSGLLASFSQPDPTVDEQKCLDKHGFNPQNSAELCPTLQNDQRAKKEKVAF